MDEAGIDPRAFRTALGRFATGVTVVTASTPAGVHGMTANAFSSVSLNPPLVLVAVSRRARMHGHLLAATHFGVSVLADHQEAHAWHFAGRPQADLATAFVWRRAVPLLDGALAHLVCALEATHPGGDHTLFLGRVEDLWYRDGMPLVFFAGRFCRIVPLRPGLPGEPPVELPEAPADLPERWP
ncbi:MAG: flavin reductase family protein [Armatimonadota bacterium]|nr:flavin reductase family protein [Armatimonadota bacterium]MDR7437151.1 flavin reductase family protein [Armatimonadota bacterium]MDR7471903.1 flavin reductase family protein [Armatimonadota bacterium]MDR7507883.1 flavin reductase family protein [Armatimonadota bacterium]MDR7517570.1 flavin reductase family protein [Armatimonadota bacterium]